MHSMYNKPYVRLLIMTILSFVSMYVLMYAMVHVLVDIFPNINQLYMAGLMTAPMVLIELAVMGAMYRNKLGNVLIVAGTLTVFAACFLGIRNQWLVSDVQFLKSMIPHHSSAVLMCQKAHLKDPEVKQLCSKILVGQQSEIDWMKAKLLQLDK